MKQEKKTEAELAAIFNTLSTADKMKLRTTAALGTMPGIVGEDVKAHPWKAPIYTGLLPFWLLAPPGTTEAVIGAYLLARPNTPWAQKVQKRLHEPFNAPALAVKMESLMTPDPKSPGNYKVGYGASVRYFGRQLYNDGKSVFDGWHHVSTKQVGPALKDIGETTVDTAKTAFKEAQDFSTETAKSAASDLQEFSEKEVQPRLKAVGETAAKTAQDIWTRIRNNPYKPF